jgi:hypothetical protein
VIYVLYMYTPDNRDARGMMRLTLEGEFDKREESRRVLGPEIPPFGGERR